MLEPILLVGILLVGALAFANGSNDVSKGIATLVGSGVTDYRRAIGWGTLWTVAGGLLGLFFSMAMVRTFTNGILIEPTGSMPPAVPIAVILGSMGWVLLASRLGLPVSTTHAITGALCGAGLAAWGWGGVQWISLSQKVFLPLALSPLLAFGLTFLIAPAVRRSLTRWKGHCLCVLPVRRARLAMEPTGLVRMIPATAELTTVIDGPECERPQVLAIRIGPDTFHWITSGLTSLARGLNDAPKMVALLVGLSLLTPISRPSLFVLGFGLVALGMGLGGYLAGRRVTEVLAERVTRMDHLEGLAANLSTALLVTFASRLGLPVSTTHLSTSAIIATGLQKGAGQVDWRTVGEMVLAWVVTIPVAGFLSAGSYLVLTAIS